MTKANAQAHETVTPTMLEEYPNLAAYVSNGGSLKVKRVGWSWYVTVSKGSTPDLGITLASSDLDYALRQADGVSRSWVMA